MVRKKEEQFANLLSRIRRNRRNTTQKVSKNDGQAFFPKLAEDNAKEELKFLHSVCHSKWGVRGAVNLYNNAVNNADISYKGLYGMARSMGIGII